MIVSDHHVFGDMILSVNTITLSGDMVVSGDMILSDDILRSDNGPAMTVSTDRAWAGGLCAHKLYRWQHLWQQSTHK